MKKVNMPYVLDDRVVIPDSIKSMTKEQKKAEIARLEKAEKRKKQGYNSRMLAI